jgi:hypothetical protein
MSQSALLVLIAILGVTGTLSGVWLGNRLTRRNEDRKWRRDRCLEAYSELVRVVELLLHECDLTYVGQKCGTEEHTKQADLAYRKMAEMNRIALGMQLVAPRAVKEKMWELTAHVGNEIVPKSIRCPKIEGSEFDSAKTKAAKLMIDFIYDARNDLGIDLPLDTIEGQRQLLGTKEPWRQSLLRWRLALRRIKRQAI